jgi:hypothetical protein
MKKDTETLAGLVLAAVADGLTYVQLSERAVDPETGYQPSANMLWRVARQKGVKVNPDLVRAIAAGLRIPVERAQTAAAYEFTGLVASGLVGGTAVHMPGADVSDAPKSRAKMESWAEQESQLPHNHSGQ